MADRYRAKPADDNPYAQYYVVKKGDTLSKIAEEFYGDKMLYPKIFEANRDLLYGSRQDQAGAAASESPEYVSREAQCAMRRIKPWMRLVLSDPVRRLLLTVRLRQPESSPLIKAVSQIAQSATSAPSEKTQATRPADCRESRLGR